MAGIVPNAVGLRCSYFFSGLLAFMHIRQLFQPGRPVFSVEVFPPKTPQGVENLQSKLHEMARFKPDFFSVTYGAGGGTRHTTGQICAFIKHKVQVEVLAHLTCISHTPAEIHQVLQNLWADDIQNIIALRGDPPPGQPFVAMPGGFHYAADLVTAVKAETGFGVAVAGYPEGHVEAKDYAQDQQHLLAKVRAGADFIISQYFLDNTLFFRWRDDLQRLGIQVPIQAGVMPAQSLEQITRFSKFCGATVPEKLRQGLARFENDPAGAAGFGIEFAQAQVAGLLKEGVDGVHLYSLNKLEPVQALAPLFHAHQK